MQTVISNSVGRGDMGWPEEAQPLFADRKSLDGFLAARAMVGEAGGWGDIKFWYPGVLYGNCSNSVLCHSFFFKCWHVVFVCFKFGFQWKETESTWMINVQIWRHGPAGSQEDFQRHTLQSAENDASVAEEGLRKAESVANEFEARSIWQGHRNAGDWLMPWDLMNAAFCSMPYYDLQRVGKIVFNDSKVLQTVTACEYYQSMSKFPTK